MVYSAALFLLTILHVAYAEHNSTTLAANQSHGGPSHGVRAGVIAAIVVSCTLLVAVVACLLRAVILRYGLCRRGPKALKTWPHTPALGLQSDDEKKYATKDHTRSLHDTLDRLSSTKSGAPATRAVVVDMSNGLHDEKADSPFFSVPVDLPETDYASVREQNNRMVELRKQASTSSVNVLARVMYDGSPQAPARSDSPTVPPGLQSPSPPSYKSGAESPTVMTHKRSTSSRCRMPPAVEHVAKKSMDAEDKPRSIRWEDGTLYRSPSTRARMQLPEVSPVQWTTSDPFASASTATSPLPASPPPVDELRRYLQSAETVQKEVWTEVKEQISRNNSITEEWRDVPLDKTPR
ncbi:hypothetical protein K523DRAFT_414566 [Schizophyllum commune Tattone D]|nr:hypothetical protein K523DRAFT_414566 [Schizophyllum commune Tattone D]